MIIRSIAVALGILGGIVFAALLATVVFPTKGLETAKMTVSIYSDEWNDESSRQGMKAELIDDKEVSLAERLVSLRRFLAVNLNAVTHSILLERKSIFDGTSLSSLTVEEKPIAVMFDNFSLARQQLSGLNRASIVYEALTEGGITRIMGVFTHWTGDRVGPIRSARHYFLNWALEYSPAFVHAGASPQGDDMLRTRHGVSLLDFDEDEHFEYSYRDFDLDVPHNLFSNLGTVASQAIALSAAATGPTAGFDSELLEDRFCFDTELSHPQAVTEVSVNYSGDASTNYFVWFQYDPDSETYKRWYKQKDAVKHVDSLDERQVAPRSVIVQVVPWEMIDGDAKERINMEAIGSGTATFFSKGYQWSGRWEKTATEDYTRFYDDAGVPLCLNSGQVWIAVVGDEELVDFQ